jgi:hypothetical protein
MEASRQQCSNGSRAAAEVAEAAVSQQAASSGAAGWQDIGGRGGGRAVEVEAAWQQQRLHEGGGSSAEVVAGRQGGRAAGRQWQRGSSRVVLAAEYRRQRGGRVAEQWSQHGRGKATAAWQRWR